MAKRHYTEDRSQECWSLKYVPVRVGWLSIRRGLPYAPSHPNRHIPTLSQLRDRTLARSDVKTTRQEKRWDLCEQPDRPCNDRNMSARRGRGYGTSCSPYNSWAIVPDCRNVTFPRLPARRLGPDAQQVVSYHPGPECV